MDEKYVDIIIEKMKNSLLAIPNGKSGFPIRITYILNYNTSTVVNGFDVDSFEIDLR